VKTAKPKKQRRKLYQAPLHERYRRFSSPLSSELRTSHNTRSVPVRSGDTVRIMRGDYKGFEGKVTGVDREKYRIFVEGVTRDKVDGTTVSVPIHPSKVMITRLNLDDKWRTEALKRKSAGKEAELPKKEPEKPPEEEAKPKPPARQRKRKKKERKSGVKSEGS